MNKESYNYLQDLLKSSNKRMETIKEELDRISKASKEEVSEREMTKEQREELMNYI